MIRTRVPDRLNDDQAREGIGESRSWRSGRQGRDSLGSGHRTCPCRVTDDLRSGVLPESQSKVTFTAAERLEVGPAVKSRCQSWKL